MLSETGTSVLHRFKWPSAPRRAIEPRFLSGRRRRRPMHKRDYRPTKFHHWSSTYFGFASRIDAQVVEDLPSGDLISRDVVTIRQQPTRLIGQLNKNIGLRGRPCGVDFKAIVRDRRDDSPPRDGLCEPLIARRSRVWGGDIDKVLQKDRQSNVVGPKPTIAILYMFRL